MGKDCTDLEKLHETNGSTKGPVAVICKNLDKTHQKAAKPLGERRKAVWRQEFMVLLGNTGVLGGGMAVALPSVTLTQLNDETQEFFLSKDETSWFASIYSMACPLGGLLVGYLMDRIGRKKTMLFTNFTGVLGWLLLALAPYHDNREAIYIQMLVARFISGVMVGLCISPTGVYSAEISLPKIRGRLILGTSIAIAVGILFMYILGYFIRNDWQLIAIISCVYQLVSLLCVLPLPETPSWLMQQGKSEKARASLKYFRGLKKSDVEICDEFETELVQISKATEASRTTSENESLLQAIRAPEVYKPLLLMIGFFLFQQCSGVVVIVVFAAQIAEAANVSTDPELCAVFVGVARMLTIFFVGTVFEKWGRRPSGLISAFGMTVCMGILAVSGWWPTIQNELPFLSFVCIVLHIVFSTLGLLTLPFFMISEVFPQRVRGVASGFTVSMGLLISFIVIKLYPAMDSDMGTANVFAFYGIVSLIGCAYIYYLIPETKGRTLLEIEQSFATGKRKVQFEMTSNGSNNDVELKEVFIKSKTDFK